MPEKIKTRTFRFPAKENPNMEKALFDWPIRLQYDIKAKFRLIGMKFIFFFTKSHERLYPFDKPIKSFYFRSFVVSILFARFHFKVIRKSLYRISERHAMPVPVRKFANWIPWFFLLSTACTSAVVTLILYTFFHLLWHFRYVSLTEGFITTVSFPKI